ncbi:hypothetical protein CR513_06356, partial [Mucuna pruriens]
MMFSFTSMRGKIKRVKIIIKLEVYFQFLDCSLSLLNYTCVTLTMRLVTKCLLCVLIASKVVVLIVGDFDAIDSEKDLIVEAGVIDFTKTFASIVRL